MEFDDVTVNDVAVEVPNMTAETPLKPLPEIVIEVPPAVPPVAGVTPDTVGALAV
jgi:hypothetical protein